MKISHIICITLISICILSVSLSAINLSKKTEVSNKKGLTTTLHTPICPTDINRDGITNGKDVELLLKKFGQSCKCCCEDVNGDGIINSEDLSLVLLNQDTPCRCGGTNSTQAVEL